MSAKADAVLKELEEIATYAIPEGERDCIIELHADADQIAGYQASIYQRMAASMGFQTTFWADEERFCILEVRGWLAMGCFAAANGELPFKTPETWFKSEELLGMIAITVYPLWPDDPYQHVNPADLQWDIYRPSGHCCFCNGHKNGLRLRHKPSSIEIELHADQKEPWLRDKALQMFKSLLRFLARPGASGSL